MFKTFIHFLPFLFYHTPTSGNYLTQQTSYNWKVLKILSLFVVLEFELKVLEFELKKYLNIH